MAKSSSAHLGAASQITAGFLVHPADPPLVHAGRQVQGIVVARGLIADMGFHVVQKGEEGLLGPLPVGHPALHLMIDPPRALIIGMKRAPQRPGPMAIKRIKPVATCVQSAPHPGITIRAFQAQRHFLVSAPEADFGFFPLHQLPSLYETIEPAIEACLATEKVVTGDAERTVAIAA